MQDIINAPFLVCLISISYDVVKQDLMSNKHNITKVLLLSRIAWVQI